MFHHGEHKGHREIEVSALYVLSVVKKELRVLNDLGGCP